MHTDREQLFDFGLIIADKIVIKKAIDNLIKKEWFMGIREQELMGLLGTVLGMITAFSKITQVGVGDPVAVAGGISQALFTTAAGIAVAIIALIFHRYFKAKVNNYIVGMEQEAIKLIELVNQSNSATRRAPNASVSSPTPATAAASSQAAAALAAARRQRAMAGGAK